MIPRGIPTIAQKMTAVITIAVVVMAGLHKPRKPTNSRAAMLIKAVRRLVSHQASIRIIAIMTTGASVCKTDSIELRIRSTGTRIA
jgi:hypothetical protein